MEKMCVIVGASIMEEKEFLQGYQHLESTCSKLYVIAADKGYETLRRNHIAADLIVGDFDSLGETPTGSHVIKHPVMKDDTDVLLAIKEGLKRGYTFFVIFGGMGGRPDHTFGNLQILGYLRDHGARGILFGDLMHATLIKNEKIIFDKGFGGTISVFAYSGLAEGVCIKNLKYELDKGCLDSHIPLGVSNEFVGKSSEIEVGHGELLIMWDKNHCQLPEFECR